MAVELIIVGGARVTIPDTSMIQLKEGGKVLATELQEGDTFLIREGDWASIELVVVI